MDRNNLQIRLIEVIRDALDAQGVELTRWDISFAVDAVLDFFKEDIELAWQYRELCE